MDSIQRSLFLSNIFPANNYYLKYSRYAAGSLESFYITFRVLAILLEDLSNSFCLNLLGFLLRNY